MTQPWNLDQITQLQLPHVEYPEEGHSAAVYAIQLRGSYLVSGSADRTIRIWNIDSQHLVRGPLEGHDGSVVCLQFDDGPAEDVIISGSVDGSVIIWQFSTGNMMKRLHNAHDETVLSLAFNEQILVTGSKDKRVKIWNRQGAVTNEGAAEQYDLLSTLNEQDAAVNSVLLHDSWVIAGSGDRTIVVWDVRTGQLIHKIRDLHRSGICDLDFDGQFIISSSSDRTCRIYDLSRQAEVTCLEGHSNIVRALCVLRTRDSPPRSIVTADYDGFVRFWKSQDGQKWSSQKPLDSGGFRLLLNDNNEVTRDSSEGRRIFDVQAEETRLVCCGEGPIVRIWKFGDPQRS